VAFKTGALRRSRDLAENALVVGARSAPGGAALQQQPTGKYGGSQQTGALACRPQGLRFMTFKSFNSQSGALGGTRQRCQL